MIEAYSLEDKISNIRKAIRNLTGETLSNYEKDYQPHLLQKIDSESSRGNTQKSLEKFLKEKYEEDQFKSYSKPLLENITEHTFDHTKDDENFSRTSFKNHNSKIITSFTSDDIKEIPSIKISDQNYETSVLLEHERENVRKLESRILKKDEIICSMNARQNNLTAEISELKKKNCEPQIEEYKKLVRNLEEKLEKYSNQISFLQSQVPRNSMTPDFKMVNIEEMQNKIKILERHNSELISKNNEAKINNHGNKQESLIRDLKNSIEKKEKQIQQITLDNKELKSRLNELQELKKDSRQEYREFKLQEEINRLRIENEKLAQKISEKTQQRSFEHARPRKRSCSSHQILNEMTSILKCSNSEIISNLKKLKKSEKLETRIARLIKDLSPHDTNLTSKHIWKWIRKVIEEYLAIKKKSDTENPLFKISNMLGVNQEEAVAEIKKICEEKKYMGALVSKIKKMLCLSPHAALREVEDTIDEKV